MELPEMRHAQFRQILRRVRNPKAGGRLDLQLRYGQLRKVLQRVRQTKVLKPVCKFIPAICPGVCLEIHSHYLPERNFQTRPRQYPAHDTGDDKWQQ